MNQRWSYSAAEPAAYKSLLALQACVDKSSLEKDLTDLVCLHISHQEPKVHRKSLLSSTVAFSLGRNCLVLQISKKENASAHTSRHCDACDFGGWKSTRQASSQEFI
jgi:hypothetical protein